ncbi:hypothetical protein CHUAL_009503 [Chamberlinius hualienensis]
MHMQLRCGFFVTFDRGVGSSGGVGIGHKVGDICSVIMVKKRSREKENYLVYSEHVTKVGTDQDPAFYTMILVAFKPGHKNCSGPGHNKWSQDLMNNKRVTQDKKHMIK